MPIFFSEHTVSELWEWSDHQLEDAGQLSLPLRYNSETDHYEPIAWEDAFALTAAGLNALDDPDRAEFYTSGRASTRRRFYLSFSVGPTGPTTSRTARICATRPPAGKGTVTLKDFGHVDAIVSFGHNPGTKHPRMMSTLHDAERRGVPIIVFNPLKERVLERFAAPQDPIEMVTLSSTRIASAYHQVRVGGDLAALKGIMKAVFTLDAESLIGEEPGVLDRAFISEHTTGIDASRLISKRPPGMK